MTPTQEQIDELTRRWNDVLADIKIDGIVKEYTINRLVEALTPFIKPKEAPMTPKQNGPAVGTAGPGLYR